MIAADFKMKGHGAKFSRKMEDAVAALLTQANVEAAARSVGISVATLTALAEGARVSERAPAGPPCRLRPGDYAIAAHVGRSRGDSRQNDGGTDRPAIHQGSGRRVDLMILVLIIVAVMFWQLETSADASRATPRLPSCSRFEAVSPARYVVGIIMSQSYTLIDPAGNQAQYTVYDADRRNEYYWSTDPRR